MPSIRNRNRTVTHIRGVVKIAVSFSGHSTPPAKESHRAKQIYGGFSLFLYWEPCTYSFPIPSKPRSLVNQLTK